MLVLLVSLLILPLTLAQFPGGSPVGGIGSGIGGYGGGERNYYVIGRLVCGIQGAQGARVSLWQSRGETIDFPRNV
ncbi:hypothetical protein GCK32_017522 [Trichostrongylus colubriformis]|uniref:Uncharacterized protein n=1 Tax=Trichostrongylus colubriformis TaxID=6319 RepID=A0AAN8FW98_TRICO